MRDKFCPKCGEDISESYIEDDTDVGIVGGWFCEHCNLGIADEDPQDYDDWER